MIWEADTMMLVQMANICENWPRFYLYIRKNRRRRGLFVFKHHWHMTGSLKNASGLLESPGKVLEIFAIERVGTLEVCISQ